MVGFYHGRSHMIVHELKFVHVAQVIISKLVEHFLLSTNIYYTRWSRLWSCFAMNYRGVAVVLSLGSRHQVETVTNL